MKIIHCYTSGSIEGLGTIRGRVLLTRPMVSVLYGVHPGIQHVKIWSGWYFGYNLLLGCTPLKSNKWGKLYGVETTQAGGVLGFE